MEPFRLLDLSSELQSAILEFAVLRGCPDQEQQHEKDNESSPLYELKHILALSLAHRNLRAAVLPFQYYTLEISDPTTDQQTRSLARTLQDSPSLGLYCHSLRIFIDDDNPYHKFSKDSYSSLCELTSLLPNVHVFRFDMSCEPPGLFYILKTVRETCAKFCSLGVVLLNTWFVDLAASCMRLEFRSLWKVTMSGLHVAKPGHAGDPGIKKLVPPNISELAFIDCKIPADVFRDLADLANKLEKLTVTCLRSDYRATDLVSIMKRFRKHENSVKVISITEFSFLVNDDVLIDFSSFVTLEELQLSRWSVYDFQEPELAAPEVNYLLAPRLRKFTWESIKQEHGHDIRLIELQFLRDIAAAAVRMQSTLQHIHANFRLMKLDSPAHPAAKPVAYVRMDELDAEFMPQGIKFTYSTQYC